eukprot:4303575-Amphidinium_carterae.1
MAVAIGRPPGLDLTGDEKAWLLSATHVQDALCDSCVMKEQLYKFFDPLQPCQTAIPVQGLGSQTEDMGRMV